MITKLKKTKANIIRKTATTTSTINKYNVQLIFTTQVFEQTTMTKDFLPNLDFILDHTKSMFNIKPKNYIKVEKILKFTGRKSNITESDKEIMRNNLTTLIEKQDVCRSNMNFKDYRDKNNLHWNVNKTNFINGSLDEGTLICETELLTSTYVDEASYSLAIALSNTFDGFANDIELIDVTQKIIEKKKPKETISQKKILVIALGIIICFIPIGIILLRAMFRKPRPVNRRIRQAGTTNLSSVMRPNESDNFSNLYPSIKYTTNEYDYSYIAPDNKSSVPTLK
ncbi:hypothetical protein SNEBB_009908 [Seison nebaliae]|nr:hypothetical protein SNEBB_009908 [Seison nebaliae]